MKLKNKLFLIHLAFALIPLIISTVFFYAMLADTYYDSTAEYAAVMIRQSAGNFDNLIEEVERAAETLEHEIMLQQALRERPELSSFDAYRIRMNRWMKVLHNYSTPRLDAFYALGEYQMLSSNDTVSETNRFKNEDWYQLAIETDGPVWFASHEGSFVRRSDERKISMVTPVHDSLNDRLLGVILIDINETECQQMAQIELDKSIQLQLLDENGNNVLGASGSAPMDDSTRNRLGLSRKNITYAQTLSNGWELRAEVPVGMLAMEKAVSLLLLLGVLILMVILISVLVSIRVAMTVSSPVVDLQRAFSEVENGNFDVRVSDKASSLEMSALNSSFNRMLQHLLELMDQIMLNQKRLRKAQLEALSAQINPHFLYNTLDTIAWNVRLGNNQSALDALYALTQLFRISISKGHDVIPLEKEFEHAAMYLKLQAIRYSDLLDYRIHLPESCNGCLTVKLVLQPLIENAIYHGIKEVDRPGLIEVEGREEAGKIVMTVTDNGVGMDEELLLRLNELLSQGVSVDREVFGILNVNLRIQMAYGAEYGIRYESEKGRYTRATVTIPVRRDGSTEQNSNLQVINMSSAKRSDSDDKRSNSGR